MRKRNVIAPEDERTVLLERIAQLEQQVHRTLSSVSGPLQLDDVL